MPPGIWIVPFAMFGFGALVVFMGLWLFDEYRKAFMANPMAVMTLDVFLAALHRGGPALAAVIALFGGAMLAASGILLLGFLVLYETGPLWKAIRLSLGL